MKLVPGRRSRGVVLILNTCMRIIDDAKKSRVKSRQQCRRLFTLICRGLFDSKHSFLTAILFTIQCLPNFRTNEKPF